LVGGRVNEDRKAAIFKLTQASGIAGKASDPTPTRATIASLAEGRMRPSPHNLTFASIIGLFFSACFDLGQLYGFKPKAFDCIHDAAEALKVDGLDQIAIGAEIVGLIDVAIGGR
jgi:hypothetical protein